MTCPGCGAPVTSEDRFCGECGRPLAGDQVPPAQAPVSQEQQQPGASPWLWAKRSAQQSGAARARRWALLGALALAILVTCVSVAAVAVLSRENEDWHGLELPTAEPVAGALLFEDDFSDEGGGWDVYAEDDTAAGYLDQEYRLGVYRANYVAWANPDAGTEFDDFIVEVDARQVEGPLDNNFGLLVRYQAGDEDYYWFQISGDGRYSVDLLQNDEWVTLVVWHHSEAIRTGLGATNHLTVICQGQRLSFYANTSHLVDVENSAFPAGNIGLGAGVFDEPGAVIHFDNLKVYALKQ